MGELCVHLDIVLGIGFAALSVPQIFLTHLVVGQPFGQQCSSPPPLGGWTQNSLDIGVVEMKLHRT